MLRPLIYLRNSGTRLFLVSKPIQKSRASSSLSSTYFVKPSNQQGQDHLLLILPKSSMPLGTIKLLSSNPPPNLASNTQSNQTIPISSDVIKANWSTFMENKEFRKLLQSVVKENIDNETVVINDAKTLPGGSGWVHLSDERAIPP
jgi:hypothetical protein